VAKILQVLTFQTQIAGSINFLQGQYFIDKSKYINFDNLENSSLGNMTVPTISYIKISTSSQYSRSGCSNTSMPDDILASMKTAVEAVVSKTKK
jgi:hypothetical protein